MSEEEIIKGINKVLEIEKNTIHCSDGLYDFYRIIQGLLDLYNKEKAKNIKLKKENDVLEIIHKSYKEMIEENDFISKAKIREKIKELAREKQLLEDKKVAGMMIYTPYQIVDSEILRLQELLKEESV